MLTEFVQLRQVICLSLSLWVVQAVGSNAHAQILLSPHGDAASTSPYDSSRRQKPVSRGVQQLFGNQESRESASPPESQRNYEFQQIQQEAHALQRQLGLVRRIVKFASPTIVHIEATKTSDPGKGFASSRIEEAGAGVIVSLQGTPHVLTNRHVIHPADIGSIRIELHNGELVRATDIWTDPATDVAVIQLDRRDLVTARLGDSDQMGIGDFVLAVGSPFGLSHSVTYGILSAKGRRNLELGSKEIQIQDFFQTDAAINPGNSGGPLLNLRGEIVGLNTAIASNSGGNEGIGFSIPINMAMLVAEQLVRRGKLARSYLGVQLENAFDILTARRLGLHSTSGALVKKVLSSSPAQRSGMRVGDVIVQFNGVTIENDGHLVKQVGLTPVGSEVAIIFYRDGSRLRLTTILQPSPDN